MLAYILPTAKFLPAMSLLTLSLDIEGPCSNEFTPEGPFTFETTNLDSN